LMEEHRVILNNLGELASIINRMKRINGYEGLSEDLEKLKNISHHLVEAEKHHQREEQALFPMLEKHGIVEPPEIMKQEHELLKSKKKELAHAAHHHQDYNFMEFKKKVIQTGEYLVSELQNHIFKEDNILYQMALQVITTEEWNEVKQECDEIGYCCFTPQAE
ncbi:MAG: hemerythrin domain-containing protein, partial [Spirochaetota bacterium]